MNDGSEATVLDVLNLLRQTGLAKLDDRLLGYMEVAGLGVDVQPAQELDAGDDGGQLAKEVTAMAAYLACPARQFWGYQMYVNEELPFSTQQGIKGAELTASWPSLMTTKARTSSSPTTSFSASRHPLPTIWSE